MRQMQSGHNKVAPVPPKRNYGELIDNRPVNPVFVDPAIDQPHKANIGKRPGTRGQGQSAGGGGTNA